MWDSSFLALQMKAKKITMKNKETNRAKIRNPKSEIRNQCSGILYVVSTPIGNLEDITLRALRILKSVDLIAAESVKHSKGLCRHYGIKTRLTSYNQHNRKKKGPELIRRLKSGIDVAFVTNAGTPGVSDPGVLLIDQAIEENISVSPVPGPSAVTAALSASGLRFGRFLFLGFLSNRSGMRRKELKNLVSEPRTMVFFEAPHRLRAMLGDLKEIFGDRQIAILRELTKIYEEVRRGPVSSILAGLEEKKTRGEFTLVVAGREKGENGHSLDKSAITKIERLLKEDRLSLKDIASQVAGDEGFSYRDIYKRCLSIKRDKISA